MTYCLGIRIGDGLVALADGRVTAGTQIALTRKISLFGAGEHRFFVMSSGLRSVREKVLAYLGRSMEATGRPTFATMMDALEAFTRAVRRVADEDGEALARADLPFNPHALVGGHLPDDASPRLFLVYPEANWIEVDERTPYLSIGATAYGKPILDRALRYDTAMRHALKLAYLSFDSTRFSTTDVGYPIDLVTYSMAERQWRHSQFDYDDLVEQRQWWNRNITALAERMPDGPWVESLLPPAQRRLAVVRGDSE